MQIRFKNISDSLLDRFGMSASFLCALHCTVVPVLVPIVAIGGGSFFWQPAFEVFMILLALVVGGLSLGSGYLHKHHKKYPLVLLLSGIALLLVAKITHHVHTSIDIMEWLLIFSGATSIIWAHISNMRLSRKCPACACK